MKRALSVLLTFAMLLSLLTVFFVTSVSAATVITNTSPAIAANVGQKITLSNYSVTFDGDTSATSGVTWKNGSTTITSFTPTAKGVTKLTAVSGSKSKSIYVVAKNANESEYVLYEANMSGFASTSALTSAGWTVPSTSYMENGDLIVSSDSVFLPSWLGEFGDYAFSADVRIKSAKDSTRWFSLMYRADQLANANDYLHLCVRSNTTAENGVEFAERTADGWNVVAKGSGVHSQMPEKYRTVRIAAFGKTVSNEVCGDQVIYVDSSAYSSGVKAAANKGYLGITMDQGELRVKNVKVTLQTAAPVKQTGMIYNDSHDASNLVNPIANVQKINSVNDSLAGLSVAYFKTTAGINAVDAMKAAMTANVVPTFFAKTTQQAYEVISAAQITGNEDMTLISDSTSVIDFARMKNNKIRLGLQVDISEEMKDGIMTDKEADAIRVTARSAPASFIVIGSRFADKLAVAELQEMALAVWVNVETQPGTDGFARDAMKALTSGANGIISHSASTVSSYIETYFEENTFTRTPITIGHRGNPNVAPENTIESFQAAYDNGGDVFEIDVQCTSDNIIVVNHDTTLNRTTNYTGSLKIAEMTWEEVKQYHVTALDGSSTGKPIPTLEETLNWARGKDIKIFVEFKNSTSNCIKLTMNKITSLGMTQQVDVISFNRGALVYTQAYSNGMSTGFLLGGSSVTCPDYAAAVDYFASRIEKAQDVKSTINPESYSCQINNLAVQAATDRGMTLWPYTFNATTTNTAFFDCPDGITTNNMELIKDMVKLMHGTGFGLEIGEIYDGDNVKYETYGNAIEVVKASELIPYVIAGDSVKVENGKLVGVKDGFSTVMFGYRTKTYNGSDYVVYTQPVSVRVGVAGSADANGEKIVYIPLDNRPINKDRVEYMAVAAGFDLVMPEESLYSTRIDAYNEGVSDQGNPEEIFEWLKTVDDAKYYIISLDQIFSGGLVGSRAPFGDTDDTIASDITNYDWTKGGYTLSDKEQEIVNYLIALSNREDTHVVFFDTVMRLASTGDYMSYRGNDYANFRTYGMLDRVQFSGSDLTISNIVKNYNKDANGNSIAIEYDPASHGTNQYTSDYTSAPAMMFTDADGIMRALDAEEFKEYYASRERKLVIADALYPNLVNSAARLYIGFDDSNPKITIQTNEGRYITEKLIGDAENCHLFSGADELGMMGVSDIATSIYGKVDISPVYFGGGENLPADEYATDDLKTSVDVHIEAIGGTINTNGSGEFQVLILTRMDNGDGYSSAETTALGVEAEKLVDAAIKNLNAGIPTAIVDCSDKDGVLSNKILASDLKKRLGELLAYSQWNTITNSLGTSISNATSRFTYLKNSINITEESHIGFLKTVVYAWVKDVAYQQVGSKPYGNEYHFGLYSGKFNLTIDSAEELVNYINGSNIVTCIQGGEMECEDNWNATISNFRWPWDRAFEATFDVYAGTELQYRDTVDYESYKISNITNGKDYTFSIEPSATYPDEGGTLTDNVIVSDSDISDPAYSDSRWVGITLNKSIREAYVTIPLDGTFDVYQFSANIGTDKIGAGVSCPNVEFSISTDGVNFTPVRGEASTTDTSTYAKNVYLAVPFEKVRATHVRVKLTPRSGGNLLWISEIRVVGMAVEDPSEKRSELPVHTYTTDETKKWWPNWNSPPCGEGDTYDDGLRLIDGAKNALAFGTSVSGWYPVNSLEMNFNLLKTSMVDEVVATFDKYATYEIPTGCKVEISMDGVNFTEVSGKLSSVETVPAGEGIWSAHEIKVKLDKAVQAKNIRLTFTTSKNSLLLCEEVDFYGTELKSIVSDKAYLTSHDAYDKYTAANYALTDGFVNKYTVYDSTNWLWRDKNTDNLKGSVIFQLDATYDLTGAATHVEMVTKSGIKAPKDVVLYVSSDGVNYTKLGSLTRPVFSELHSQNEMLWWDIFEEAKCVNFVKIEYEIDAGFILLDEIEVYGNKSAVAGIHKLSTEWSSDETDHWHACSCGEIFDKASHDAGEWITVTEAGLHKEGLKELRCTVCGYVLDSEKIAEKHSYSEDWSSDKTNHYHACSCGDKKDSEKHDAGEWFTVTEADLHKEGLKELRCTVCGYVLDSEKIPEKHSYSDDWSSDKDNHWHACSCGDKIDVTAHDNVSWVVTEPAGYHKEGEQAFMCKTCGYVFQTSKLDAEHKFDKGYKYDSIGHWQVCECGEESDTIVAHDAGKWVIVTEAGVHKEGLKELRCTCGYVLDSEKIPEKHSYSKDWSSDKTNHWHECSCGDKKDSAKHDSGKWVTVTEAGVHKEGLKELRCTVCDYVIKSETIPEKHSYGKDWSSDEISHWHACSCGDKKDSAKHDDGEWITVTEANKESEGLNELRCTVCGYVIDSEITPVIKGMLGDINDNGTIDSMDYVLLKRAYFGTYKLADDIFWRGDINGNGIIDAMDYVFLKRAYFGTYKLG